MFDNATMFMMFILLCFAGLLVMFYFVLRGMDELARGMRDEHAMLASGLRTLEVRVNELARAQRAAAAGLPPTPHADGGTDASTDGYDEPAGQYHVQYGTGPDARTDMGYGAGSDPLYGLVHEADDDATLPGGLAMDFEEPVELVDRQPDGVPGFGKDGVPGYGKAGESGYAQGGVRGYGQDGVAGFGKTEASGSSQASAPQDVELPDLDLAGPASGRRGAGSGASGLDTSALDVAAFGGSDHESDAPDAQLSRSANESGLLSFGNDDSTHHPSRDRQANGLSARDKRDRLDRLDRRDRRDKGGLPELKLDD